MGNSDRTLAAIRQLIEDVPKESQAYNLVQFKRRGVQPPSALYINLDTFLAVNIFPLASNPAIVVRLRVLGPDGQVCVHSETITAAGAGSVTKQIFNLSEGFLLDACVNAVGTTLKAGQCYVRLDLQHTNQSSANALVTLCAGYVSNTSTISYPTMPPKSSVDGSGVMTSVQIANPAAGADWAYVQPAGTRGSIKFLQAKLTASAAVATRAANLFIDDGTNVLFASAFATNQTASQLVRYSAGSGLANVQIQPGTNIWEFPQGVVLAAGWRVFVFTSSLQAGDQWSEINLAVEQWLEL